MINYLAASDFLARSKKHIHMRSQHDGRPRDALPYFVFEPFSAGDRARRGEGQSLLAEYDVPPYFPDDYLRWAGASGDDCRPGQQARPPQRACTAVVTSGPYL